MGVVEILLISLICLYLFTGIACNVQAMNNNRHISLFLETKSSD